MTPPALIVNIVTQMEGGGAQKAAIQLCDELISAGYDSEVWFLYKKRPTYVSHPKAHWILDRKPDSGSDYFRIMRDLRTRMRQVKPDGVITYTHYANVLGQLAAWDAGVPHRLATQRNPSWSYPTAARVLDGMLGTIGGYSANVFVSHTVERSFKHYPRPYRERSRVVLNGLRPPQATQDRHEARREFGIPEKAFTLVNVGRLAEQKNQRLLIEAMRYVDRRDIYIVIAGDGELSSDLRSQAADAGLSDRILFLGELSPAEIANVLVAGDAFAFSSNFEAFGFALVEAMMMGLPVIASDIEAHREIVGEAGVIVPLNDPHSWATTFQQLASDSAVCADLARRSLVRSQEYHVRRMVEGYVDALRRNDR